MGLDISNFNIKDIKQSLIRSVGLLWQTSKRLALSSLFLQIIQALLPVISLYFIKILIEKVTTGHHTFSEVIPIIIAFLIIQLLIALVQQYAVYLNTIYQQKLTDYLSQKVLDKAISVDFEYYENPGYHDSLHLAQQQSLYRASYLLNHFNSFITSGFSLLFLLLFFISLKSYFAILFITFSIPLAIIKWYHGIATMQQEKKLAPVEREAAYLHHTLTAIEYAKESRVFGFGNFFIDKFISLRQFIHINKKQLQKKLTTYSLIAEAAEIIAMAFIFAMLAKQTLEGIITVGLFVVYIQGFQNLQNNSKNFLQSIVQILQQRIFLQDLFAFLDIKTTTDTKNCDFFVEMKEGLEIRGLSFRYPQTNKSVLHDISLSCKPGQIIAIVGENGSGKSTLIKLLAKLYKADTGIISFNNVHLNDIDHEVYRKNCVFLFQDFGKYFFTVEENIILGEPEIEKTEADVIAAATKSGADSFISGMAFGYKTRLGRTFDKSEQLSGGEWQKLALSRIFYRDNVEMIVLDEPTSALDANAEFEIFKQIKSIAAGKIIILITHRLYNLKIADYLYVLQDGRIAEAGKFEQLILKNGVFTQLYNMQQL